MNGTKTDEKGTLSCHSSLRLVYLGMILFVVGLLARGASIPEILMIAGLLIVITGTITVLARK